jgi:hypothetical protein
METIRIGNKDYPPTRVIANAVKAPGWYCGLAILSAMNALGASSQQKGAWLSPLHVGLVNFFLVGIYLVVWLLVRKGSKKAYTVGMVLCLLHCVLLVSIGDWLATAFFGFCLSMLWVGNQFVKVRARAEEMVAQQTATSSDDSIQR